MISEQLLKIRKERKLTMKEVADAIGVSLSAYQKYENGTRDTSTELLSKLADFYGVTTDYLLGRNTEEHTALDDLAGQFNMTSLEKIIVEKYLNLPEKMRGNLMDFLEEAVREVEKESH